MNKEIQLSDNELIQSFQDGNSRAFDALLERHHNRIYNAIFFMVKDSYLAEDLFQEILIKVIDNLKQKKYAEEGKFLHNPKFDFNDDVIPVGSATFAALVERSMPL